MSACTKSEAARYLTLDDAGLLAQCRMDRYRASGPGGQKRNKTASAVRLRHRPSGLSAVGTESRSQHENRARALRRLRKAIALSVRSAVDPEAYALSELMRSCVSEARRLHVGRKDRRYDLAVSEILDVLAGSAARVSTAAKLLGVSTANLIAFLRKDPALWKQANQMRATAGLKPLR